MTDRRCGTCEFWEDYDKDGTGWCKNPEIRAGIAKQHENANCPSWQPKKERPHD